MDYTQPSLLLLAGSFEEAKDSITAYKNVFANYGKALDVLEIAPKDWPQNEIQPGFKTRGILPSILLQPTLETTGGKKKVEPGYEYEDWRGQKLNYDGETITSLKTEDRYNLNKDFPKGQDELKDFPYSMRDIPLIFGDSRMDYFRHGLQTIDNLTPIENPVNGNSSLRLDQFKTTPFENNDPIMYGFEIIIDSVSSPLLNGSVLDFINQYTSINEIAYKKQVYEDFKNHIESQFEHWMNWDNYGLCNNDFNYGWDIDHIIPCASAKSKEELLKLNHYTNLRPLCSHVNRNIKRDRLDF